MITILFIILIYAVQLLICASLNLVLGTRIPDTGKDFLLLTFLPTCIALIIMGKNT